MFCVGFIPKPKFIDKRNIAEGMSTFRKQIITKYLTHTVKLKTTPTLNWAQAAQPIHPKIHSHRTTRDHPSLAITLNKSEHQPHTTSVLDGIQTELAQMPTQTKGDNITRAERTAVKSLQENKS